MNIEIPLSWILLPFLGLAAYWKALNGKPIFDDKDVLGGLQQHFSWSRKWLKQAVSPYSWRGRPLTVLSLASQNVWPNTMRGLHVGNILLHSACGLAVEQIAQEVGFGPGEALFAGMLCVLHPFAVNTVGYVTGRASILSTLLGLLSVIAALTAQPLYMCVLLTLAILSKEDALGFVPVLAGVSWMTGQSEVAAGLSFMIGAGIVHGIRKYVLGRAKWHRKNGDLAMKSIGLPVSLEQPDHGITVAVETLLRLPAWCFGFKTSPYHGSGVEVSSVRRAIGAIFVLMACIIIGMWAPLPVLLILAGPWLIYLLCPLPDQLMEYRNYSAVAGFTLLIAGVIVSLPAGLAGFIGFETVIVCFLMTRWKAGIWAGPESMWRAALANTSGDRSRALQELGVCVKGRGNIDQAEAYFRQALTVNPNLGPAMNNLAWLYVETKKVEDAELWFTRCIDRCPDYPLGWEDLGIFCDIHQQGERAKVYYQRALELEPRMEKSANRLGLMAFHAKELESAARYFDHALRMHPGHFEYVYNMAVTLKTQGHATESIAMVKRLPQPCPLTQHMLALEFTK